jgi:hypothetical protein
MKRDIERHIDTIDTALTTPALIGSMFLLAFIASHSLVLAVAVGCVTWAAAWYFWRRGSSGERRTGEDRVEIVVAQPPTPADDEAQSPPEAPEERTSQLQSISHTLPRSHRLDPGLQRNRTQGTGDPGQGQVA